MCAFHFRGLFHFKKLMRASCVNCREGMSFSMSYPTFSQSQKTLSANTIKAPKSEGAEKPKGSEKSNEGMNDKSRHSDEIKGADEPKGSEKSKEGMNEKSTVFPDVG